MHQLNFSTIMAQEYIELAIKIRITDLTMKSALTNKVIIEKSVLLARPTACEDISASIQ